MPVSKVGTARREKFRVNFKGKIAKKERNMIKTTTKVLSIDSWEKTEDFKPNTWGKFTVAKSEKVSKNNVGGTYLSSSGRNGKPWQKDRPGTWTETLDQLLRRGWNHSITADLFCLLFFIIIIKYFVDRLTHQSEGQLAEHLKLALKQFFDSPLFREGLLIFV